MFVGHYSASFAAKALKRAPPLAVLFAAAQAVDILFFSFVLTGIEKMKIEPGITVMSPLDLYYMPWTHSLPGALGVSVLFGLLVAPFAPRGDKTRWWTISALVVFSHWLLDLVVHRPDLGLWWDTNKVGFGLWNRPEIEMPLELGLLTLGTFLYARATRADSALGRASPWIVLAIFFALQIFGWYGPVPTEIRAFAVTGLAGYGVVVLLGVWLDRARRPRG